ncbi:MAG TPA: NAD-dependent epimerase/dehydratase family protein [Bacteroidales bacterium]|nr:NAD-dependent epimerase/dehydratase family protein [Bacteroidales bacterium]
MIFLTGASGLLGSHVLYELVRSGRPVKALYRNKDKLPLVEKIFSYYARDAVKLMKSIEWVRGDVVDYYALRECMTGANLVFHAAGMVSFMDNDKKDVMRINAHGTANVVNACMELGVGKLCFVSSIAALGESTRGEPVHENMLWNAESDVSAYAVSKFQAEMEVWRGIHEGLQAVIVNPSVIIGPGMWYKSIAQLINMVSRGLRYYPAGSGGYVDVRDVARAMIILTDSNISGERFIINAENIPHRDLVNAIAKLLNRSVPDKLMTPVLMKTICILERIRSVITGTPRRVNWRTLKIAADTAAYSNQKITEAIGLQFIPVKESVEFVVNTYLKDFPGIHTR